MTVIIPEIMLTLTVYVFMYTMLYPPQALVAFFFNGPTGVLTAWLAMIHQSAVVASMLSKWLLLPTPLRMLFEAVSISIMAKTANAKGNEGNDTGRI